MKRTNSFHIHMQTGSEQNGKGEKICRTTATSKRRGTTRNDEKRRETPNNVGENSREHGQHTTVFDYELVSLFLLGLFLAQVFVCSNLEPFVTVSHLSRRNGQESRPHSHGAATTSRRDSETEWPAPKCDVNISWPETTSSARQSHCVPLPWSYAIVTSIRFFFFFFLLGHSSR